MAGIDVSVVSLRTNPRATKSQSSGVLQNESTDRVFGRAAALLHDSCRHSQAISASGPG